MLFFSLEEQKDFLKKHGYTVKTIDAAWYLNSFREKAFTTKTIAFKNGLEPKFLSNELISCDECIQYDIERVFENVLKKQLLNL